MVLAQIVQRQHSQQWTGGMVNTAKAWRRDRLLQQAFFYGRSGGKKKKRKATLGFNPKIKNKQSNIRLFSSTLCHG